MSFKVQKHWHKYNAVPQTMDGIQFASTKERDRYAELKLLLNAGKISDLKLQFPMPVYIKDKHICIWKADFVYWEKKQKIYEDCKGFKTPTYKLKKKMVEAFYDIEIRET